MADRMKQGKDNTKSSSPHNRNNSIMNENNPALETPKINEGVLARLDKAGAHFKFVQMFRKLKNVILNDS